MFSVEFASSYSKSTEECKDRRKKKKTREKEIRTKKVSFDHVAACFQCFHSTVNPIRPSLYPLRYWGAMWESTLKALLILITAASSCGWLASRCRKELQTISFDLKHLHNCWMLWRNVRYHMWSAIVYIRIRIVNDLRTVEVRQSNYCRLDVLISVSRGVLSRFTKFGCLS